MEQAINNFDYEMIKVWLEQGNDPNSTLHLANGLTLLQDVLLGAGDPEEEEILYKIIRLLIDNGALVQLRHIPDGLQPLFLAVNENYKHITKLLLEHGASLDLRDKEGYTPLIHAVASHDTEMAKLLASYASDKILHQAAGHWAYSPLGLAISRADKPMISALIKYGCNPYNYNHDEGKKDIDLLPESLDETQRTAFKVWIEEIFYRN